MEIRRLNLADLQSCFACRLRALENSPSSFLTTVEEQKSRGPELYSQILSSTSHDNVIFGAVKDQVVVGMLGIRQEDRPKTRHKALLWGVYVDKEYRRQKIGDGMLKLATEHARKKMNAVGVYLTVESDNFQALKLYESQGFRTWGIEPQAMLNGSTFASENHMVFTFSEA